MSKLKMWAWSELQVPVKSIPPGTSTYSSSPLFSRGSSCEKFINSGDCKWLYWDTLVHGAFCFTDRNGRQKQNCESLKRMWRNFAHLTRPPYQSIAWRPTGMHCWIAQRHKWITCSFSTGNSAGQLPCVKTNQCKWRFCFWISFKDQLCQTAKG